MYRPRREEWRQSRDCAFPQPIGAWQLDQGGNFISAHHFGTIAKSVLKSRFCAISSNFCDFTRFQPDFTHFWFFQAIQPVMHVLTRKIVRFYESKRDFNNFGWRSLHGVSDFHHWSKIFVKALEQLEHYNLQYYHFLYNACFSLCKASLFIFSNITMDRMCEILCFFNLIFNF